MKTKPKIVTHDGVFHADEVFAIALLSIVLETDFEIIRTRDVDTIEAAKKDPNIFVIDVGMDLNPDMLNFDHHQSQSLPASNILVMYYLQVCQNIPDLDKLAFMIGISNFDTNYENIHSKWETFSKHHLVNLNHIIGSYNRDISDSDNQDHFFDVAVSFAIEYLHNIFWKIGQDKEAEEIYNSKQVINDCVAIFDKFCSIWKEKDEFMWSIHPNPQGWALISKDSENYPLPEIEHKDLIFAHKGKFIAIFKTKEAAIEIASTL
jgi:uncharacterized UPF0160 family protein